MNAQVQIIEKNGKPEFAVIPYAQFQYLLQLAEDGEDIAAAQKALSELESGKDETVPAEVVNRLIAGKDHPLRIWREYRGFTQDNLAQSANISKSYISQIETGLKPGSIRVLSCVAEALSVDVDDILA